MSVQCKTFRVELVQLSDTAQSYIRKAINQTQVAYKSFREVALKYPGATVNSLFAKCPLVFTSPQWILSTSTLYILANRARTNPKIENPTRFIRGNVLGMPISKQSVIPDLYKCTLYLGDQTFFCRYQRGGSFDFIPKFYGIDHRQFAFGDLSMEIDHHGNDLFYLSLVYKVPTRNVEAPLFFPKKDILNRRTYRGLYS